jgi:hypothetical protein
MRKALSVWILFGWFFFTQGPWQMPGEDKAMIRQAIGPFSSEMVCKAEREEVMRLLKEMGSKHVVAPCQYASES